MADGRKSIRCSSCLRQKFRKLAYGHRIISRYALNARCFAFSVDEIKDGFMSSEGKN